ncbi:MAG: flagellin [Candidatus Kapabacteria bacterium]|nr:flagellin [Ignavibacteriota bacterium]MCW5884003.1 flagellin [Candidatus Kapabacteria bacterium]
MATAISGGSRIRTNTPAENAYNALKASNDNIALRQLRLSTGKRINSASDDVAGYITSRALQARNTSLKSALKSVGEAKNVTAIVQDSLDNIQNLLNDIKQLASNAASGALGTDEKVALAKGAFRLAEQIQTIVDSTVFGGRELLDGTFSGSWNIGFKADNSLLNIDVNLKETNTDDFNIVGDGIATGEFNLNSTSDSGVSNFAAVEGLNLADLDGVASDDLDIFSEANIATTLQSLSTAINNVNKVASYIGGIDARLTSQESLLTSQITNYNAAISRIEDADVAEEQLELIKSQFLQQASLVSLTQANQNPQNFLQLFR